MRPFEKYLFQSAKNRFASEQEAIEKWITPTLESGAILHVYPKMNGKRAALHKRGSDFYLQIEGEEGNLAKAHPALTSDFVFYDFDFVIEGVIGKSFAVTDVLYLNGEIDGDLTQRIFHLQKAFVNHSGYWSDIIESHQVETEEEFKQVTSKFKNGFTAGIDTSLYTEGCPSNQWCTIGEVVETAKSVSYDTVDFDFFENNIQKGVSGSFSVHESNGHYELRLQPVRPIKNDVCSVIKFQNVDNTITLKRQFEKGNLFSVGFSKLRSPNPSESCIEHGSFTILKSGQSTTIDFDGFSNVFKGIFNVDGVSKHNLKDDSADDVVYQLSYSDANIEVDKNFGRVTWGIDDTINKNIMPISKAKEEERFVFGEVLVPEDIDAHGDIYSGEEVRFAAHFYMENFANTGLMHAEFINDKAKIVETFVAPVNMTIEGRKVKKGTWLIGMRILDDDLFASVKLGKLTGFSIGGIATVQELRKYMAVATAA